MILKNQAFLFAASYGSNFTRSKGTGTAPGAGLCFKNREKQGISYHLIASVYP
jgi:hypothetical protein